MDQQQQRRFFNRLLHNNSRAEHQSDVKLKTKPSISPNYFENSKDKIRDLQRKLRAADERNAELEGKLREARVAREIFEAQSLELQQLKSRCNNFEVENLKEKKPYSNYGASKSELERELREAKRIISTMKDSAQRKELLEEQILSMEHRLQHTKTLERQVHQLESVQIDLLAKIEDYEAIGIIGGPAAVSQEIARLQRIEAASISEKSQLKSKIASIERNCSIAQHERDELKKWLDQTTQSYELMSKNMIKMQKKMKLVTRERDSYRQQLDAYENETTACYGNNEALNAMNQRILDLERSLMGYRELVAILESDLEKTQQKQCNLPEVENSKLNHNVVKSSIKISSTIESDKDTSRVLIQEVEQLCDIGACGKETRNAGPHIPSNDQQLEQEYEVKITRLKEEFNASLHKFRKACFNLLGWRIEMKEDRYILTSLYSKSRDDYLCFMFVKDDLEIIKTPFLTKVSTFFEQHLKKQKSVPMFLNAVLSELFYQEESTISIDY